MGELEELSTGRERCSRLFRMGMSGHLVGTGTGRLSGCKSVDWRMVELRMSKC